MSLNLYLRKDNRTRRQRRRDRIRQRLIPPFVCLCEIVLIYISVSFIWFAYAHPWMSVTEILVNGPNAMTWRVLPEQRQ